MSAAPPSALVVLAHPDDCDLGCGGTVAKWTRAGARVTLIVLTDGSKGSHDPDLDDGELRTTREAEQRASAEVLGISEVRFCGEVDGELREHSTLVATIAGAIRELRPDTLVTHDPWRRYELHADHLAAGRVTLAALYDAKEPRAARHLLAQGLVAWRPRTLLLVAPDEANHIEDISSTFATKVDAALRHRSQYVTSFGIEEDSSGFVSALRRYAQEAGGTAATLGERFRRIELSPQTA